MKGTANTARLSILISSVPLRIRKYPFSPQFTPQEFFTIQYFSLVFLSIPYPTTTTAWLVNSNGSNLYDDVKPEKKQEIQKLT